MTRRPPPRVPPSDEAAERSLLGALLLAPSALASVDGLRAVDFYRPAHSHIFDAIGALAERGEPVDPVTVADQLSRAGLLENVGGLEALTDLEINVPATSNAGRYASIIADHARRRRVIASAVDIVDAAYDRTIDLDAALARFHLPAPSVSGGIRLSHQRASDVKVVPPVWLWPYWLVAAAVQLLVGRQGSGKSTFAAWVVAQLSSGRPWPDDTTSRAPLRCGMLSLEEPPGRLAARLSAAGADLDAVEILGDVEDHDDNGSPYRRPWRLPGDCGALEATIVGLGLAAVTIDGLGYAIAGDSHNYANVGSALSALAGVADRTGCSILGLTHPPKGNSDAVTAAIGSTAWTAVARISWVMGFDPTDEIGTRRVVRPAPGSNYRLPDHGLSFTIGNHDETEAGFVTGLKASDVDPQTITAPPLADSEEERSALDEACDFLRSYLTNDAGGPTGKLLGHAMKAEEVKDAARKVRISDSTLARARLKEKVFSKREGFGPGSVVWWSLTPIDASESHTSQRPEAGTYGESWHLWGEEAE
jgi:hypothetical protein